MKKTKGIWASVILVLLIILILVGLSFKKENMDTKEDLPMETPNEEVFGNTNTIPTKLAPFQEKISDEVILSFEEIKEYNEDIQKKTSSLYEVDQIKALTKKEIEKMITSYSVPSLPKYNGNSKVTTAEVQDIKENRNLENVQDLTEPLYGMVVERSDLRSFPSMICFYNSPQEIHVDLLQEAELLIGTKVLVVHESKDQKWYFVVSPNYYGWVLKEGIALGNIEDFVPFSEENPFVVVTSKGMEVDQHYLDMSVRLPLIKEEKDTYQVALPIKAEDRLGIKEITLSKTDSYLGYLPYTALNLYSQALKYEGTIYAWGGKEKGVDCSSFISNVFRTFGFNFPRNTSSQNTSVGKIIDVTDKIKLEKLSLIEQHPLSLLYQKGHVMLYLGVFEDKHYIIHANGSTWDVSITPLEESSYLQAINKIVLITK